MVPGEKLMNRIRHQLRGTIAHRQRPKWLRSCLERSRLACIGKVRKMIDRDGRDWLSFHPQPKSGAGGEYRGFPDAVHQQAGNHQMNRQMTVFGFGRQGLNKFLATTL